MEDPLDPLRKLVAIEPAAAYAARVSFSLPMGESSSEFHWFSKQGMGWAT